MHFPVAKFLRLKKSYINNFEQRGKVRVVSLFAEVDVDSTNRILSIGRQYFFLETLFLVKNPRQR